MSKLGDHVTQLDNDINSELLHAELTRIVELHNIQQLTQISVTGLTSENAFECGNGRLSELLRPESEYNVVMDAFKGTYIELIVNQYSDYYRWRFLFLPQKATYSIHVDSLDENLYNFRLHVPVVTNPHCYMMFYDNAPQPDCELNTYIYHLKENHSYITNTTSWHSATNYGTEGRWHLVGVKYVDKRDGS